MDTGWRNLALALVVVVLILSTVVGAVSISVTASDGHNTCVQVNALRIAVTNVLQNSAKGLPHSPYFKQHPDQLKASQRQIAYDLSLFKPVAC